MAGRTMSSGGSVQSSLFDDLDDAGTGPVVVVGLVAGEQESTDGSGDRSSDDVATAPADTETREPTTVRVGGRAADHPRSTGPVTRRRRRSTSGDSRLAVLSAEEWGRVQAAKAPVWSAEKRRRVAALLGLVLAEDGG
ncbi:hypothetical protein ACG83_08200 [Frankia sp. R43]|nr:hypothetical protein ACG83_08200 [Frankia sp. R43]